jgi:hypothetical protein
MAFVQNHIAQPGEVAPEASRSLAEQAREVEGSQRIRKTTSLWRSRKSSLMKLLPIRSRVEKSRRSTQSGRRKPRISSSTI